MPSNPEYSLTSGDVAATIVAIGASVRRLRWRGRDLVLPFGPDEVRPSFRGCVLAPWPNRVAQGRWRWHGVEHQLTLTEPERGHALHGLVAWSEWAAVAQSADTLTLATRITPQPGYPFTLDLAMTWRVDDLGLVGELTAANPGTNPAPFGCSIHPYLVAPADTLDDWELHVPARRILTVDDTMIPTGTIDVPAEFDFRRRRRVGATTIDHAYTGIEFEDSTAAVTLVDRAGDGSRVVFGAATPWVQVCTSDWPGREGHRRGVAVEPMSCPPNALATHVGLTVLPTGGAATWWWRIEAL